jgi:hypothetical protein
VHPHWSVNLDDSLAPHWGHFFRHQSGQGHGAARLILAKILRWVVHRTS